MKMIIPALKAKLSPEGKKAGNDISIKGMGILDHIEKVLEITQEYDIDKCLIKGKIHVNYISAKLGITPIQAVLFSHFMEKSDDNYIHLSEIADSIKCSKIRMIKYSGECEALEKKKLIRIKRDDDISYRVPASVCKSIRLHNEFKPENIENLTIDQLFSALERIFEERGNNELTYYNMKFEILDLINLNMHLLFCSKIMSYNLYEDDLALLVCFCCFFANNDDDNIGAHDIEFLY